MTNRTTNRTTTGTTTGTTNGIAARTDATPRIALPATLEIQLSAFRRHVWTNKMLQAVLIALGGVFCTYLSLFVVDRLTDAPPAIRFALAVAAAALSAVVPWFLYRWVWRQRRPAELARLIARRMPALGDQLLGVIELADNATEQARSPELCYAAIQQGALQAEQRDLTLASPAAHLRAWSAAAALGVIASLTLALTIPDAAANAWQRLLSPWTNVPRYTFANVERLPATLVVPHGEPFHVACRLRDGSLWQPALAYFRLGSQPPAAARLDEAQYVWTGPPMIAPANLRIDAGDWSQVVRIEPKLRPELTALDAHVELPAYLEQRQPLQKDGRSGALALVRGSRAALTATINRPLESSNVEGARADANGPVISIGPLDVVEQRTLQIRWKDAHGLEGKQPFALAISAEDDAPPTVASDGLPRRKVLLDSEQLTFRVAAHDDFGVREVGMEWRGLATESNLELAQGERLIAPGDATRQALDASGTFSAQSLGIAPQPLELRLYAVDYFPDRPRTYSAPVTLYVLNAEDHAIWVTDQLARWHRQSLEVRDRELQLYETNKQLRQLPEEALDRPETRRQIEQQAAAERANGQRLSNLTLGGAELLKIAARNPEIGVGHLDRWAEMLSILQDIAAHRMPTVADLLHKASAPQLAAADAKQQTGPTAGIVRDAQARAAAPSDKKQPTDNKSPASKSPQEQAVPQIADVESSQQPADNSAAAAGEKKNASPPTLRLPTTTLAGNGKPSPPPAETTSRPLEKAVEAQRDLLAEFEKVANELNSVLANLEGSTLVKRLKAASRKQYGIAGAIGDEIGQGFGRRKSLVNSALRNKLESLSVQEEQSSRHVSFIMDDMQAYFERRQLVRFKAVLDDMRREDVLASLRRLAEEIPTRHGLSIAQCEYWSDALDRWAEDLVDPACSGQCPGCPSRGSLPPSIVLEVLKILEGEIQLREETRGAEQARPGWNREVYGNEAGRLSSAQTALADRVEQVVERIRELPEADELFAKEIGLLGRVDQIMDEASKILVLPDTGPPAVAAETEAIELLLQSKRINPSGGGGGGSSPGGGGGGEAKDSALALLGAGLNPQEVREQRSPSQATGETGAMLPTEFRTGLDRYFNALEEVGAGG